MLELCLGVLHREDPHALEAGSVWLPGDVAAIHARHAGLRSQRRGEPFASEVIAAFGAGTADQLRDDVYAFVVVRGIYLGIIAKLCLVVGGETLRPLVARIRVEVVRRKLKAFGVLPGNLSDLRYIPHQ